MYFFLDFISGHHNYDISHQWHMQNLNIRSIKKIISETSYLSSLRYVARSFDNILLYSINIMERIRVCVCFTQIYDEDMARVRVVYNYISE